MIAAAENIRFSALGGEVVIQGEGPGAMAACREAEAVIHQVHRRLTRFDAESELCRLNADPRSEVPGSDVMIRFAEAVVLAGRESGGLVDATLLDQVERSGYVESIDPDRMPDRVDVPAGDVTPGRGLWREVSVDRSRGSVIRPPGIRLDSGGLGKGLASDLAAEILAPLDTWAVNCAGDLRFGGAAGKVRQLDVSPPDPEEGPVASLAAPSGAAATSGITRRSWRTPDGPSHHLIDPRTGLPAATGLVQVTALATTGLEAEIRAKTALLAGPERALGHLPDGGVVITEDGEVRARGFEIGG